MNWAWIRYAPPIALVILLVAKFFYAPLWRASVIPGLPWPSWYAVALFLLVWGTAWALTPIFCRAAMRLILLFAKWGVVPVFILYGVAVVLTSLIDLASLDIVNPIFSSVPPTHAVDWLNATLHHAFFGS